MIEGDDQCIWNLEILFSYLWLAMRHLEASVNIENDTWDLISSNPAFTTMLIPSKVSHQVSQQLKMSNTFDSSSLLLRNSLLDLIPSMQNPSTLMDK